MPWAKLHTDILGDPKLMRAARKGARELVYLPWLIAFAKQADDSGRLTIGGEAADPVDIADLVPGATPKAVTAALTSLVSIGVLAREADGAVCFTQWDARSGGKPSDSPSAVAERVARHRAKQREAAGNASGETPGNAPPETPGNAEDVTLGNATEKRRGEKRREEENRGEEKRGADAPPRPSGHHSRPPRPAPPAWAGRLAEHWVSRVGATTPAKVAKLLASAVAERDEPRVLAGMDAWMANRRASGNGLKLEWFAEVAIVWADRAATPETEPLLDNGWMSPALERETRPVRP